MITEQNKYFILGIITISIITNLIQFFKKPIIITKEIIINKEIIKEISNPIKKRNNVKNPTSFSFKIEKELAVNFDNYCLNYDISRPKLIETLILDHLSKSMKETIIE